MLTERQRLVGPAASRVRGEVLTQHQALRSTLDAAVAAAQKPSANPLEVAHLAHEIRTRFRAHLAFEERVLVPVLAAIDVWGPDRIRDLIGEHARQRAELEALVDGIEHDWDDASIARVLRGLAASLLRDMAEEERDYLGPELLRDYLLMADRD
jgi:hypothetical protein